MQITNLEVPGNRLHCLCVFVYGGVDDGDVVDDGGVSSDEAGYELQRKLDDDLQKRSKHPKNH